MVRPDATAPLAPGQTYTAGAPNSWAQSSVDAQLGLVYIGLGNQSPDQLGAGRSAEVERFPSTVIALDVTTGKLRWQRRLPAGRQATPTTYRIHGRQMVVVAAGGHGSFGTTQGDTIMAYELK